VPWDQNYAAELSEDAVLTGGVARRYRVNGCDYANQVRAFVNHAELVPPGSVPPGGDVRLVARVPPGASSWLVAVPVTCRWLRVDRTNVYRLEPELIRLLSRPLAPDDIARIRGFGSCELG